MSYDTDPAAQIKLLKALERSKSPDVDALKTTEKAAGWPKPTAAEKKAARRAAMLAQQAASAPFIQGGMSRGEIACALLFAILALALIFGPEVIR